MSSYNETLAKGAGLLTLKMVVSHLATVRTRIMTADFKADEDHGIAKPVLNLFKVLLGAYGPTFENPKRLLGIVNNSVENEPFWFAVALMLGQTGKANDTDSKLILAYVACRFIHAFCYIFAIQPFRAFSYTAGLGITGFTAARLVF
eukprot:TRINITY_DN36597_c0_g1_i1.p1 TRINITY_DN36597_c0_g1~~TRINITY_DN36597_c0_g1_i1.p1  ORF type:complete len:147 (+),score=26.43 TRINITY_DN36597_c0_g1_i1:72-512(+)